MLPKISVIMPARNEEKYISRAINSVINQSYKNIEILILDDKSTDRTTEIIKEFCLNDTRIKYIEGNGIGVANARNLLYAEAKGDFIVNADADDECSPNRVEKLVELVLKIKSPCIVGSYIDTFRYGKYIKTSMFPIEHDKIKSKLKKTFGRFVIAPQASMGSAELYKSHPVNEKYKILSDWDQFLRIQEDDCVKLGNVPEALYQYNINDGSISQKKFRRTLYSAFLRDSELKRVRKTSEYPSLEHYLKNFWKTPESLIRNSFFLSAKYIQQFIVY